MRKIFILAAIITLAPVIADAQLGNILNKVKNKTKQRADQKVDQQIDKIERRMAELNN